MKMRGGFVSNSSTTSFCICGTSFEPEEARELLKWDHPKVKALVEKWGDDEPLEILESVVDLEANGSQWGSHRYFGLSWSSIQDDETGAQFKERIKAELSKYLKGDFTLGTCEEAWYDG